MQLFVIKGYLNYGSVIVSPCLVQRPGNGAFFLTCVISHYYR